MQRVRAKLTYSNVMVTVLALIVLGGGTAFAAKQMLPKNSVGAKQLKNSAVTGAKIKNGAVSAAKLAPGTINPATLGTVPNANHANTAGNAEHAESATSSTTATNATNATNAVRATTAERAESVPAPEAIHVVTNFEPGCSATATENLGQVGFYKDAFGEVHLVGGIFCTNEDTTAFFLPPGFRPSTEILQPTVGDAKAIGELLVLPSGAVRSFDSKNATLFGVSFRTN
jgi:hypothetical protein